MQPHEIAVSWKPVDFGGLANGTIVVLDNMGVALSRMIVRTAIAQMAIECGLVAGKGRSPNYCLSGMKTSPTNGKYCWQYFKTHELYTTKQLIAAENAGRGLVQRIGPVAEKPELTAVWLVPKHPYCCFRAFESLDSALEDHFTTLQRRFPHAWNALIKGDSHGFAKGLKADRYYTALESVYDGAIQYRIREGLKALPDDDIVWGDIE